MWNLREWGVFFKKLFKGALWGVGVAIVLFFYDKVAGLWNCFCKALVEKFYLPEVVDRSIMLYGFVICVAIGAIVGVVSATKDYKNRVKKQNAAREARNYGQVCGMLTQLTEKANSFSDVLVQHKTDVTYCGQKCAIEIEKQMEACDTLYEKIHQSYAEHTNVRGEA